MFSSPTMIKKLSSKTSEDILSRLVEIHKECISKCNSVCYTSEQIEEWLSIINIGNIKDQLKNTSWAIIKEGADIIGFGQYSIKDKELYQIQIDPQKQGKGYGKELYKYIEDDFKNNNVSSVSLFSTLNAVPFYERLGFKFVRNIKFKLIKTELDMVEMIKTLN